MGDILKDIVCWLCTHTLCANFLYHGVDEIYSSWGILLSKKNYQKTPFVAS
jgi:hypothetical protein